MYPLNISRMLFLFFKSFVEKNALIWQNVEHSVALYNDIGVRANREEEDKSKNGLCFKFLLEYARIRVRRPLRHTYILCICSKNMNFGAFQLKQSYQIPLSCVIFENCHKSNYFTHTCTFQIDFIRKYKEKIPKF